MTLIPEKLGAYAIRRRLGAGAMGVVYLAWDARLDRQVAIKTLWPELALETQARKRFLREAKAVAAISHPNVTQIYDIGEDAGDVFFAMEFVDGRSLAEILQEEGQLPVEFALSVTRQAATGLQAAAERGIIHRDIKPANLVLTADGVLKITDFGLAKQTATDSNLTTAGLVVGTPHYLSPEQATGESTDVRSDIYSLGATLYELLTGQPPFRGDNPVAVILQHARAPVPSPARLRPGLPAGVSNLVQRMLAKRPEGRPQDHEQLIHHLDRLTVDCGQTVAVPRPSLAARSTPPAVGAVGSAATLGSTGIGPSIPLAWAPAGQVTPAPQNQPGDDRTAAPAPTRSAGSRLLVLAFVFLGALVVWGLVKEFLPAAPSSPFALTGEAPGNGGGSAARDVGAPGGAPGGTPIGTSEYAAPPGARGADLAIVTKTHEITEDGLLRVAGEITNQGRGRATGSRIEVTLTDNGSGEKMHSVVVPVTPERLGADETGEFEAFFPNPHKSVHIGLELSWVS